MQLIPASIETLRAELENPGALAAVARMDVSPEWPPELYDRDPIESVSIAGHKLTVVYLTRPDDAGSATVAVRRTAVYGVSGSTLTELSHTDAPYTP